MILTTTIIISQPLQINIVHPELDSGSVLRKPRFRIESGMTGINKPRSMVESGMMGINKPRSMVKSGMTGINKPRSMVKSR